MQKDSKECIPGESDRSHSATLCDTGLFKLAAPITIFILALVIRLYFVQHVEWFARSDTRDFHEYALNLLRGEGFVNYWNEAPVRVGFVSRQVHSVGYPLFLAGVYRVAGFDAEKYARSQMVNHRVGPQHWSAVGFNPRHALMVHIVLDLITMGALLFMATRLFGFGTAMLAQLCFAFYVTWTPQLISETLFITLFTGALALLVADPQFRNRRVSTLFAVVSVLAVMTKPIAIILYAFPGLWFLRRPSFARGIHVAALALPLLIFIAVMFARSYHYYGQPFISSTGAQHVATHNYGFDWTGEHLRLRQSLGRAPDEAEWMNHFRALKRQADREDPVRTARIYFQSLTQMFSWEPDWHMHWLWQANFHRHPDVAAQHRRLFSLSLFAYPLGIIGMMIFFKRAWIPAATIVLFLLLHAAVSPGNHRYMAPVNVLFIFFSAALLARAGRELWRTFKEASDDDSPPGPASSPTSNTAQ